MISDSGLIAGPGLFASSCQWPNSSRQWPDSIRQLTRDPLQWCRNCEPSQRLLVIYHINKRPVLQALPKKNYSSNAWGPETWGFRTCLCLMTQGVSVLFFLGRACADPISACTEICTCMTHTHIRRRTYMSVHICICTPLFMYINVCICIHIHVYTISSYVYAGVLVARPVADGNSEICFPLWLKRLPPTYHTGGCQNYGPFLAPC